VITYFAACGKIGKNATQKKDRKKCAIEKRWNFLIRVDGLNRVEPDPQGQKSGRVGLAPLGCKQGRVGLALRVKNWVRGGSGWSGWFGSTTWNASEVRLGILDIQIKI
jgi:hypothetical protein